jgi:hypothetical protein
MDHDVLIILGILVPVIVEIIRAITKLLIFKMQERKRNKEHNEPRDVTSIYSHRIKGHDAFRQRDLRKQ